MKMSDASKNSDMESLIAKYLAGSTSPEEEALLESWVKENPENKQLFLETKRNWGIAQSGQINFSKKDAWNTLSNYIDKQSSQHEKKEVKTIPLFSTKNIWRIAATIIVLTAAIYSFLFVTQFRETKVVAESDPVETQLNDGTIISINRSSLLTYNAGYGKDERRVHLEGEAFFEVEKDTVRPFIV